MVGMASVCPCCKMVLALILSDLFRARAMKTLPLGVTHKTQITARNRTTLFLTLSLVGPLLFALWLRWRYIQTISLYVDEFTTLWAARRVQQLGAPIDA